MSKHWYCAKLPGKQAASAAQLSSGSSRSSAAIAASKQLGADAAIDHVQQVAYRQGLRKGGTMESRHARPTALMYRILYGTRLVPLAVTPGMPGIRCRRHTLSEWHTTIVAIQALEYITSMCDSVTSCDGFTTMTGTCTACQAVC